MGCIVVDACGQAEVIDPPAVGTHTTPGLAQPRFNNPSHGGDWPLAINDETVVESCRPLGELVLLAKLTPLAAARITLRLEDIPGGCRVAMHEVPAKGPSILIPGPAALMTVWPRNRECLSRLATLAERRRAHQLI